MTRMLRWRGGTGPELLGELPGLPPGVAQSSAVSLSSARGCAPLKSRFAICRRPKLCAGLVARVPSVSVTYLQGVSAGDEPKVQWVCR